jgi:bacterioferritin (cytochrome b1)
MWSISKVFSIEAIKFAHEVDDQGTVDLLTTILKMEEVHVNWAEIQRVQIEHALRYIFIIP